VATWVNLTDLHEQTGYAVRTLQYIRTQEPGVLIAREKGGRTEYKQPDCAINLRKRELDAAKKESSGEGNLRKLRERREAAETREAEIRVERLLAETLPAAVLDEIVGQLGDRLRAVCVNIPGNHGMRLEEMGVSAQDAETVLTAIAEDIVIALLAPADELEEAARALDAEELEPPAAAS
jgi:hypothetical protein